MEKTATKKNKKVSDLKPQIIAAYKDFLLLNGKQPHSVYQFTKELKINEEEFYKYYSSFEAIDQHIWSDFAINTIHLIEREKVYGEYTSREKMLAFYFTLIEHLKKDRSYVAMTFKPSQKLELVPSVLKEFKHTFDEFASHIVNEGLQSEEIVKRPVLSDRYKDGIWLQLVFVIGFWLKDTSKDFENTDAAIEKSVNLSFELMGRGPLDMMVDFGKFLYQNK